MKKLLKKSAFFILVFSVTFTAFISISYAKKQPSFNIKIEKEILNYPPKLGDIMEVIFTVASPYDLDDTHFMLFPMKGLQLISLEPIGFIAREETDERYMKKRHIKKWLWFKIKANEKLQFKLKVKINDTVEEKNLNTIPVVSISVGVESFTEEHRSGQGGQNIRLFLINKKTGLLGTQTDMTKNLSVEYRYDAVDGTFFNPDSVDTPANIEWNSEIILMMRELEPALSDSEALLLHSDHYKIGIPRDAMHWDEKEECWITNEKKMFEIFLKDGWYDALQQGERNEWIETEKEKIKEQSKNIRGGRQLKSEIFSA